MNPLSMLFDTMQAPGRATRNAWEGLGNPFGLLEERQLGEGDPGLDPLARLAPALGGLGMGGALALGGVGMPLALAGGLGLSALTQMLGEGQTDEYAPMSGGTVTDFLMDPTLYAGAALAKSGANAIGQSVKNRVAVGNKLPGVSMNRQQLLDLARTGGDIPSPGFMPGAQMANDFKSQQAADAILAEFGAPERLMVPPSGSGSGDDFFKAFFDRPRPPQPPSPRGTGGLGSPVGGGTPTMIDPMSPKGMIDEFSELTGAYNSPLPPHLNPSVAPPSPPLPGGGAQTMHMRGGLGPMQTMVGDERSLLQMLLEEMSQRKAAAQYGINPTSLRGKAGLISGKPNMGLGKFSDPRASFPVQQGGDWLPLGG